MADRSLYWVIGAKTGPFQTALKGIKKDLSSLSSSFTAAGKTMTAAITVPLVGIATTAVKTAVSFESSFAGVRKTVDATEEEFATLRKGLVDLTKAAPHTFEDLAAIAEAAGQLGIKKEAILGFTRTMADLGVTTNMVGDEAASTLARFANITQMDQSNFDRLGATLVDLGNNLATTEAEIAEMSLRIAAAGETVGMTEAEILSFAGALSSVGIEAQAGGTAISRVMIDIADSVAKGGEKMGEFAKVAGVSADEFTKSWKTDPANTMVRFIEGLRRIDKAGGNVFATLENLNLGEIRVRDALLRAMNAGDLFRDSLVLGNDAWEKNTALVDEAGKRYETTESQFTTFKNNLRAIADTLGTALLPRVNDLLKDGGAVTTWLQGLADKFAALNPAQQENIIKWTAIAAAAGPVTWFFGAVAGGLKNIILLMSTIAAHPAFILFTGAALIGAAIGKGLNRVIENAQDDYAETERKRREAYVEENGLEGFVGPVRVPDDYVPPSERFIDRTAPKLQEFGGGGTVAGPLGSPQMVIAHAGEQILTPNQRGGITINVNNPIVREEPDIRRIANEMVRQLKLAGVTV